MHCLETGQMEWKQEAFKEEGYGHLTKQETEMTKDWVQLSPNTDSDSIILRLCVVCKEWHRQLLKVLCSYRIKRGTDL